MKNLFEIELKKNKNFLEVNNPPKIENSNKKQKILIATPSLDGKVDIWYADSLSRTITLCEKNNIEIIPIFICNESIIHMARNQFIKFAYEGNYDSLVFIDGDQSWDPIYFLKVVQSKKDALALPVCLKNDTPKFNLKTFGKLEDVKVDENTGEFTIFQIGTGFFKLSKKIIKDLWNSSETIIFKDEKIKMVFDFSTEGNTYVGEDYTLCKKIREIGYDVWVNPNSTCNHIGQKKYRHDFKKTVGK